MLSPIPEILEELKAGRQIILVDDENRENEGDLICAAESITPEIVNFMTKHTPGYLCVALSGEVCDRLELHPQAAVNTSLRSTAMAVSIDGHPKHGVSTGISASDRAKTARLAADPNSQPEDLTRPGHLVPLRARDGGVLARTGQTEGSVDLMKLAELQPASVISEICRDDGEMARMPELEIFSEKHSLKMCSVEQVIQYRLERERLIHRMTPHEGTLIETDHGTFNLIAYDSLVDPLPHLVLAVGGIGDHDAAGQPIQWDEPVLVRVHRRNLLGDIFGDQSQPTNRTLAQSLEMIQAEGRGALIYLRPSGVGEGLLGRLQSVRHDHTQLDVNRPDLRSAAGVGIQAVPMEQRDFGVGGQILRDLGLHHLRVITDHPRTLHHLEAFGLDIAETVPVRTIC